MMLLFGYHMLSLSVCRRCFSRNCSDISSDNLKQAAFSAGILQNKIFCPRLLRLETIVVDSDTVISLYDDPPNKCPNKMEHAVVQAEALARKSVLGKKIGSKVYVHRYYEHYIIPKVELDRAKNTLRHYDIMQSTPEGAKIYNTYECVRYDKKTREIAFQCSPDFNHADEPTVGDTLKVSYGGEIKLQTPPRDPFIWHHKWRWVLPDYPFFDYNKSKERSQVWEPHVTKAEKRRIGRKSFWDSIRSRWENTNDLTLLRPI